MIILLSHSKDWKRGRLKLYCLEIFPSVYLVPKTYNKEAKDRIVSLLNSNLEQDEGIATIEYLKDGTIDYNSYGQGINSRKIKYLDGIPYFSMKHSRTLK